MRNLIMLAVLSTGVTLAGTSDAEANHRWGGGWGRPHYGYSYGYSPRYYGYSSYSPQHYGYGYSSYYSPRYYGYSSYSPRYYGGYYGGYGYGGYSRYGYGGYGRRGFSLYVGPGGVSVGYNRFRW